MTLDLYHIVRQPTAQNWPDLVLSDKVFSLLFIILWGLCDDFQGGVEISPLRNFFNGRFSKWPLNAFSQTTFSAITQVLIQLGTWFWCLHPGFGVWGIYWYHLNLSIKVSHLGFPYMGICNWRISCFCYIIWEKQVANHTYLINFIFLLNIHL